VLDTESGEVSAAHRPAGRRTLRQFLEGCEDQKVEAVLEETR
jgi:hypothetical protein